MKGKMKSSPSTKADHHKHSHGHHHTPAADNDNNVLRHVGRKMAAATRLRFLSESVAAAGKRRESPEERRQRLALKLRQIFRFTVMITRVCVRMRVLSMHKTEKTRVTELYYYNATGNRAAAGGGEGEAASDWLKRPLAFDKALFSRDTAGRLPLAAKLVASKAPRMRTEEDIKLMFRVMDSMRSFKERLTREMKMRICQYATYLTCATGRVIVREGHTGDSFYFVYSGSVFVQVEVMDHSLGRKRPVVENVIGHGASFGELALLCPREGRRTATVVSREPSELFMIDKDAFVEVLNGIFQSELQMKIDVASKMSLFEGWPRDKVESLCFQSQLISYPHGKLIEKDWSNAQFIYHVIKGKVFLLREINAKEALGEYKNKLTDSFGRTIPDTHQSAVTLSDEESQFLTVGALVEGDTSDCRILSDTPHTTDIDPITMVSQCVYVLRFSLAVLLNLAPKLIVQHFLEEKYRPIETASVATLQQVYCERTSWETFKSKVKTTVLNARNEPVAMMPATAKGGTGGCAWPGSRVHRLRSKPCLIHQEGWGCACPPQVVFHVAKVRRQ